MHRIADTSMTGRRSARAASLRPWRSGEQEIAFETDRAGLAEAMRGEALADGAVPRPTRRIRSIVFDTAADDLAKRSIVLRGYEIHGASFLELSWSRPSRSGDARSSMELRVPTLDFGTELVGFSPDLRRSLEDRPLEARCVAEIERHERTLVLSGARIGVAFDDGAVEYCGKRAPYCEIRLRLLEGPLAKFWRFAAELARELPLRLSAKSEIEFAMLAVSGRNIPSVKARAPQIAKEATLDDAVAATIGSCLDQFLANGPALLRSREPEEAIHQMRVALRRLRAAIGVFVHGVSSPALVDAAARAKTIANALGAARNLDILQTMLTSGALARLNGEPSYYALLDAVECRRAQAHENVRAILRAPETTRFALDLRAIQAERAWTNVDSETAARTARDFAVASLDRLHRKAVKRSRDLASSTPEERHGARIAFKKARYGAEFFASLFEKRGEARKYLRRSADIQDALGAFNDMATAEKLLREIGEERRDSLSPAIFFALGWCARAQSGEGADWAKTEKSLKKLKPFWR